MPREMPGKYRQHECGDTQRTGPGNEDHIARGAGCWLVRRRRTNGEMVYRTFSDGRFGGAEGALAAARAFRDELIGRDGPSLWERGWCTCDKRSTTGIVGVSWTYSERAVRPGRVRRDNCPTAVAGGRDGQRRRRFSIPRYGLEGAFRRAVAMREQWIGHCFEPDAVEAALAQFRERYCALVEPEDLQFADH